MGTKRYELTESEWERIKDILPPEHPKEGKRGRPAKYDNRSARRGAVERTSGAVWALADNIQSLPEMAGRRCIRRGLSSIVRGC